MIIGGRTRLLGDFHRPRMGDWKDGKNGVIWEAEQIAEVVGGVTTKHGLPGSICTDTRIMQKGDWFLALVGHNFDGNDFLHQALAAGCAGVISRSMPNNWPVGCVEVPDTLQALQKLAMSVRQRYRGPVVGITGSCGKTTTRAMTALALKSLGHIHQTQGNLNNHVGLPLTLLKMPSYSSACVLEMGMSRPGDILQLSNVSRPSVRVILNVGPAHLENFSGVDGIAAAKGELLLNAKRGDTCILNADDPLVMALPVPEEANVKLFGSSEASDLRWLEATPFDGGRGIKFTLEQSAFPGCKAESVLNCPGRHLATNVSAAACVATTLGIRLRAATDSISKFSPVAMRSTLESMTCSLQLINDAYNANPLSMTAALELLATLQCSGRKVVALGDMLELGSMTKDAHLKAIKHCQELQVDIIGTAGPAFSEALDGCAAAEKCEVLKCENSAVLADRITRKLRPGDAVLVKGSRGMRMEYVVDAIKSRFSTTS